jgi:hypothetical protein
MGCGALTLIDYGTVDYRIDNENQHPDEKNLGQAEENNEEPKIDWITLLRVMDRAVFHEIFGPCSPKSEAKISDQNREKNPSPNWHS